MTPEQFNVVLGLVGLLFGAAFWAGVRYGVLKTGQDQHTKQIDVALGILTDQTKTILANSQTLTTLAGDFSRFHADYEGARYRDRFGHVENAMRQEMSGVVQGLARVEALLAHNSGHHPAHS